MSAAAFGLHAIHARPIHTEPAVAARIAALLADKRWPSPMTLVRPTPKPGATSFPWPSGKVPTAKLAAIATDVLVSDQTLGIHVVASARRTLGEKFVRAPEWGTYLSAKHVAAVGREKLVAAAAIAKDVGKLLYLQCSAHAADALGPEARERRIALAALLAPISVG